MRPEIVIICCMLPRRQVCLLNKKTCMCISQPAESNEVWCAPYLKFKIKKYNAGDISSIYVYVHCMYAEKGA